MTRFIMLCRHGRHKKGRLLPVRLEDGTEEYPAAVVGSRLNEYFPSVVDTEHRMDLTVRCAPTMEALYTLRQLATALDLLVDDDHQEITGAALGSQPIKV